MLLNFLLSYKMASSGLENYADLQSLRNYPSYYITNLMPELVWEVTVVWNLCLSLQFCAKHKAQARRNETTKGQQLCHFLCSFGKIEGSWEVGGLTQVTDRDGKCSTCFDDITSALLCGCAVRMYVCRVHTAKKLNYILVADLTYGPHCTHNFVNNTGSM